MRGYQVYKVYTLPIYKLRLTRILGNFKNSYDAIRERLKLNLVLKLQYIYRLQKRRERRAKAKAIENARIERERKAELLLQKKKRARELELERIAYLKAIALKQQQEKEAAEALLAEKRRAIEEKEAKRRSRSLKAALVTRAVTIRKKKPKKRLEFAETLNAAKLDSLVEAANEDNEEEADTPGRSTTMPNFQMKFGKTAGSLLS